MASGGMIHVYQVSWRLIQVFKQYYGFVSEIFEAGMLVLLMGSIYDVCQWDGVRQYDILAKFHVDWYRSCSNIKVLHQKSEWL
jgi:hypothetical protein